MERETGPIIDVTVVTRIRCTASKDIHLGHDQYLSGEVHSFPAMPANLQ